ncbi:MAG: IS1595 family transposase [Candidatus Acidiferrales bacterium]
MTLVDVNSMFSTDDKCRELLKKLRWPNGVRCLRCGGRHTFEVSSYKYECRECAYQFTVTAQSIFHDSHLPLTTWFLAVLLIVEARKGMSANQLKRTLGIAYKTAWYLCHRIRAAMNEAATQEPMGGTVEMDETYVGGARTGKRGRGAEGKEIVIGIRQRGGDLRFFHAEDVKSGTLAKYVQENISADVEVIMTDDFSAYPKAVRGVRHETVTHSAGEYVRGDIHTNTVESAFSLLKRGIIGTWHKISAKHLPSYLNEMTFRFNRRKKSDLFVDTLRHMITTDPLTFEKLTA